MKDQQSLRCKALFIHALAEMLYWCKIGYYNGHYAETGSYFADEEYDKLETKLGKMCPDHPIMHCVGAPDIDVMISTVKIFELIKDK